MAEKPSSRIDFSLVCALFPQRLCSGRRCPRLKRPMRPKGRRGGQRSMAVWIVCHLRLRPSADVRKSGAWTDVSRTQPSSRARARKGRRFENKRRVDPSAAETSGHVPARSLSSPPRLPVTFFRRARLRRKSLGKELNQAVVAAFARRAVSETAERRNIAADSGGFFFPKINEA